MPADQHDESFCLSSGSFTAWFDCDEMFTDHAVTVYGSLKKDLKATNIEG